MLQDILSALTAGQLRLLRAKLVSAQAALVLVADEKFNEGDAGARWWAARPYEATSDEISEVLAVA